MYIYYGWWFGTFCNSHILRTIIPTDELIFFRGAGATTNQIYIYIYVYISPIVLVTLDTSTINHSNISPQNHSDICAKPTATVLDVSRPI